MKNKLKKKIMISSITRGDLILPDKNRKEVKKQEYNSPLKTKMIITVKARYIGRTKPLPYYLEDDEQ
jgi:hypothetical protein